MRLGQAGWDGWRKDWQDVDWQGEAENRVVRQNSARTASVHVDIYLAGEGL